MARTPRKQREIDETRAHILAAAARVFAAKGFDAATMQEIADAAEYSAPSLYTYFKGKQALLEALFGQLLNDVETLFPTDLPGGLTLAQRVELLLRHQNAWVERNRDALVCATRHTSRAPLLEGAPSPLDIQGGLVARLTEWFRENATPRELHGRDPSAAAHALSGLNNAFHQKWLQEGAQGSASTTLPLVLDLFFYGLRGSSQQ